MKKHKAIFNWSGGKDSAHALWKVLSTDAYDVVSLLTAVEAQTQCSSLHNIPAKVFVQQARSIGLPLYIVQSTPAEYATAISQFKSKGVTHFIFGDIFLTEVKQYREQQLHPWGIKVVEPLWEKTSAEIMEDYLNTGLQSTIVSAIEPLGSQTIGKIINRKFISSLPIEMDCNGENGEYHTLCHNGPLFKQAIHFRLEKPELTTCHSIAGNDACHNSFWSARIIAD